MAICIYRMFDIKEGAGRLGFCFIVIVVTVVVVWIIVYYLFCTIVLGDLKTESAKLNQIQK